jgi:hypothetical protein
MARIESIWKAWCPSCGAVNYVNNGDPSDFTCFDVEGVACHACEFEFPLGDDEGFGSRYEKGRAKLD